MAKEIIADYTKGRISTQLLKFSVPFMLSNGLQVLYALIDMIVVGKYVGSEGLSAVSTASQIFTFMTMLALGFSNSGQVLIAQYIGKNEREKIGSVISTLFAIITGFSVVMCVVGLLLGRNVLNLLNTPAEAFEYAWDYTLVCSLGIFFSYGYNMVSAVFRGMGDSRHPFIFVLIASAINVVLDIYFIRNLGWGTMGAALATIIGQAFSFVAAVVFLVVRRNNLGFEVNTKTLKPSVESARLLIKLGIPYASQSCAVNLSMMFVNSLVNDVSVAASAVFGVGIKVDDTVNKITQGIAFASSTMCAQNIAAGNKKRTIKISLTTGGYCAVFYALFALLLLTCHEQIYAIFTDDPAVIALSSVFVSAIVWSFPAMTLMRTGFGFLRGLGNAKITLAFGLTDALVLRVGLSYLFGIVMNMGLYGFFLGYGLAAFGTGIPACIYLFFGKWENYKLLK
ncbi:MAG: MATE family efflux transporter [Clostridia bacterium]|nr:MATE family efflux transporter [Clostridia bacterium]